MALILSMGTGSWFYDTNKIRRLNSLRDVSDSVSKVAFGSSNLVEARAEVSILPVLPASFTLLSSMYGMIPAVKHSTSVTRPDDSQEKNSFIS